MPIKKSALYSSLWASCDQLRGGMDASQYKDYILSLLFIKYVSDKYAGVPFAPISVPKGASFEDMTNLKGKPDIGDQINKKIIAPLVVANQQLSRSDFPDFADATKLGSGKDMVDRLTKLIGIFQDARLDFSKNRAGDDDLLGDAYEYLMRNFATQSGKSKGQFYTPAEVSRVIAQVLGIHNAPVNNSTTVYDPTCGSGSLLLKVADEARATVTLYGQDIDVATSGLARMNMILHNHPTALIKQGNTLANPQYLEGSALKTFDYVVANPPFSLKNWSNGIEDPLKDPYHRFQTFGAPPARQGDYAFLLHIVASLKSTGRGACILPHGVLFRGNAEGEIRRNLVRRGYIQGIIGLPANLFYGTGIPACIIVLDKQDAAARKGIFMIDASKGFIKDGPKNRLRAQDIHKIVDTFKRQADVPKYARLVGFDEIEKNEFNLNLPRYIDSQAVEDLQDIEAHLRGGIPERDIEALAGYWAVCPGLKALLFRPNRPGYLDLAVEPGEIKRAIMEYPEFCAFLRSAEERFASWNEWVSTDLKGLKLGFHPREAIAKLSEDLLAHYAGQPLIDRYDIYQHLMDYWAEAMQDDCYLIAQSGWKAETTRILEKDKRGVDRDKGWTCDLVPKELVVARYFAAEQAELERLASELEIVTVRLVELEEEESEDEGAFTELEKVNKASVGLRLRETRGLYVVENDETRRVMSALDEWLKLNEQEAVLKKELRDAEAALDAKVYVHYPKLNKVEVKTLVVDDKWMVILEGVFNSETERASQRLTGRVKELAEHYTAPLPKLSECVDALEADVWHHLERMGFTW